MTPVNIFWHHFVSIMSTGAALFWVFCNFQMRPKVRMSMMNIGRVKSNRRAEKNTMD